MIADLLRKNYPDITFVSARVQGTRLLLTIQEENLTEDIQQTNSPCNLISDLDGILLVPFFTFLLKKFSECGYLFPQA